MIKQTAELPMFHIWMEKEAKLGPNEVCSALLIALMLLMLARTIPPDYDCETETHE